MHLHHYLHRYLYIYEYCLQKSLSDLNTSIEGLQTVHGRDIFVLNKNQNISIIHLNYLSHKFFNELYFNITFPI